MPAERVEDDRRQRHEHDVTHFGRSVRQHTREYDDHRDELWGRPEHHAANYGRQPAGSLGNADAQQGN
jgi:hypothetical protein